MQWFWLVPLGTAEIPIIMLEMKHTATTDAVLRDLKFYLRAGAASVWETQEVVRDGPHSDLLHRHRAVKFPSSHQLGLPRPKGDVLSTRVSNVGAEFGAPRARFSQGLTPAEALRGLLATRPCLPPSAHSPPAHG